jgi:MATE family multidrug resistance protein
MPSSSFDNVPESLPATNHYLHIIALDTLCSQAWTGASDKTLVGVHLQRALVVQSIMLVPIGAVWWHGEYILLALNQEPDLAAYAGKRTNRQLVGLAKWLTFDHDK